jgi:ADP-ribosylglycohydrolase
VASAGNGVAMRSAPIGLFYREDFKALTLGSILQAVITHDDPIAVASGLLTAHAVALLSTMQPSDLVPLVARQDFCRRLANVIYGLEATGALQNPQHSGTCHAGAAIQGRPTPVARTESGPDRDQ